jgi:hypothetical protein
MRARCPETGFRPQCALVVLSRADWSQRASNPLYGMPYYNIGAAGKWLTSWNDL